jgi:hypothetical protein
MEVKNEIQNLTRPGPEFSSSYLYHSALVRSSVQSLASQSRGEERAL